MKEMQSCLQHIISSALEIEISDENILLQTPPKKELGDLCFGVFDMMKQAKLPPHVVTEKIITYFENHGDTEYIETLSAQGPYINLKISKSYYAQLFQDYFTQKKYYNSDTLKNTKDNTIIIDYIGANVGKPLHIGHICTPLQGQVAANIFSKLGYTVVTDSHIGDWGIIFGRLIWAWKNADDLLNSIFSSEEFFYYQSDNKKFGYKFNKPENIKNDMLQKRGPDFLMQLYQKSFEITNENDHDDIEEEIRYEFKLLSEGNPESVDLWKKFTSSSIESMNILLNRLFVTPNYNIGESFYEGIGLPKLENYPDLDYSMHDIVTELIEKGIATKNDDNSVGVVFSEASKLPSCILQKRDGTHGYLASDLACIKYRMHNWNPQKILYFVDIRQQLHFRQAFMIARLAGWVPDTTELTHAYNGFISLKDGAMSTRKGRIIKLGVLLDEAHVRARNIILEKKSELPHDEVEKLAEKVGIGAIKYGYLKKSRELDSVFDWDEYMNFEGNSGPYIQYGYVRAKKILSGYTFSHESYLFTEDIEVQFLQKLLDYPSVIQEVSREYNFHQLCLYTYELTKIFSSFYGQLPVLVEQNIQIRDSRCALLTCFTEIIEESFSLLGIELPLEM